MVSEYLCYSHCLEYCLECFLCILKPIPLTCYMKVSQVYAINISTPGFCLQDQQDYVDFFNTLKGSEKENKQTNKTGVWFIKTINELQKGVRVRHTASVCSSTVVSRHILDPSGDWTLGNCPKNPPSSWYWLKALGVKSKTSPGFGTNSLNLIKSGFVEYSLSMLLFLSLFHPCKPYWFLQLLVVWPQELNNGLQLLQHLPLPKFQILYLLNS